MNLEDLRREKAEKPTQEDAPLDCTQTWQLVGALEVAQIDPEFVVGQDELGKPITNYAEHVDDVLYGTP